MLYVCFFIKLVGLNELIEDKVYFLDWYLLEKKFGIDNFYCEI